MSGPVLYAKKPVFEIVHEENVKVYHLDLHIHVQREYSTELSMRRILCH